MSDQLTQTKKTLEKLSNRYKDDMAYAEIDIKPNYGRGNKGCYYPDNNIGDFNYLTIRYLKEWFEEPLFYDWSYYVTDAKAIEKLDQTRADILNFYDRLNNIMKEYKEKEIGTYPIQVSLNYYKAIIEILDEIYNSEELIIFRNPNILEENKTLKFNLWWYKRCRKLIIHLFSFFIFLIGVILALIINYNNSGWYITVFLGIVTILFNLLFNNHQSFRDSWRIIRSSDRKKLKEQYFNNPKMWQNI